MGSKRKEETNQGRHRRHCREDIKKQINGLKGQETTSTGQARMVQASKNNGNGKLHSGIESGQTTPPTFGGLSSNIKLSYFSIIAKLVQNLSLLFMLIIYSKETNEKNN